MENTTDNNTVPEVDNGLGQSELVQMLRGIFGSVVKNPVLAKVLINTLIVLGSIFSIVFLFALFLYIIPVIQDPPVKHFEINYTTTSAKDAAYKKELATLTKDVQRLTRKFAAYTPGQSYLIINTTDNRFYLYRNKNLVREGFCSSGSYTRLVNAEGNKEWIFKTPKGQFTIQGKQTKPVWARPDWSFVEEGLPIPAPGDPSRFEAGVLGDYAMSLGDGYLIHGTIYKRLMGMPVTHGCVRLNDEDLEVIYNTLNIGSRVYIF
ncbi:MAG: L,D-transpeptidase [Bacteroidales bacterium]